MTQKEFEDIWNDASDRVLCHTSGSTGTPKDIYLDKSMMIESARRTNQFFGIDSGSRLHTCLDFQYIASKMMLVRAAEAGCELTSEEPSNRPLASACLDREITLLSVVPSQMQFILENQDSFKAVSKVLVGGSPVPPMLRRAIALSRFDAWESYGMTETASHIALRKITDDASAPFVALPGIKVSASHDGCLVIAMPGYDDIVTTDMAEVLSDSEFRILGRADNCVISGGIKIIPEQLEQMLGPFVAFPYCISSLPDEKWGERLVLVVEKGDSNLSDDIVCKAVSLRLAQYKKVLELGVKTPKEVICVSRLPLLANSKVDRRVLKSMLA